jgi:hypothetical protein
MEPDIAVPDIAVPEIAVPDPDLFEAQLLDGNMFAHEIIEQVVQKNAKQKGITDLLHIFNRHFGKYLPSGVKVPLSWHKVRRLACDGAEPLYVVRHLCPLCDWMFPLDDLNSRCPRCKQDTRWEPKKHGRPARVAAYFDIADLFIRMFANVTLANCFSTFASREPSQETMPFRDLDEAWDGSILHSLLEAARREEAEVHSEPEADSSSDNAGSEVGADDGDNVLVSEDSNGDVSDNDGDSDSDSDMEGDSDKEGDSEDQPPLVLRLGCLQSFLG